MPRGFFFGYVLIILARLAKKIPLSNHHKIKLNCRTYRAGLVLLQKSARLGKNGRQQEKESETA